MKKILVMILSLMMLFAFTACNNDASAVSIPDWLANTAWSGTVSYYVNGVRITDGSLEVTANDDDIFVDSTGVKATLEIAGVTFTESISGNSYTLKVTTTDIEEGTAYTVQMTYTFTLIDSDTMRISLVQSSSAGEMSVAGELTKL